MNSVTTSLKVFGIYMLLIPGIGLMISPEFLLDFFGFDHGEHLWMARIIGIFGFIIGLFDISIAKYKLSQLYKLTVIVRYFGTTFLILLWITDQVEAMILLFAAIDFTGATWTLLTLKKDTSVDHR